MRINKGGKIGLLILLISFTIMTILILTNHQIHDLVMWVFVSGMSIVFISAIVSLSMRSRLR